MDHTGVATDDPITSLAQGTMMGCIELQAFGYPAKIIRKNGTTQRRLAWLLRMDDAQLEKSTLFWAHQRGTGPPCVSSVASRHEGLRRSLSESSAMALERHPCEPLARLPRDARSAIRSGAYVAVVAAAPLWVQLLIHGMERH